VNNVLSHHSGVKNGPFLTVCTYLLTYLLTKEWAVFRQFEQKRILTLQSGYAGWQEWTASGWRCASDMTTDQQLLEIQSLNTTTIHTHDLRTSSLSRDTFAKKLKKSFIWLWALLRSSLIGRYTNWHIHSFTHSLHTHLHSADLWTNKKTERCGRWGAARYGAVLAVEYMRAVLGLSRSAQGGKGSLRHLPNIKLIGQQAAKLWGFFANNAISRRVLDLWPLDLETGPRGAGVPGTLPTKFGIRRPFRFPSRWRHKTDRRTYRINTWWGLLLGRTAP